LKIKKPFDFDHGYQTKMVRLLFQRPDFAESVVSFLDANLFDSPMLRFYGGVLIDCHRKGQIPTTTIVREELRKQKQRKKVPAMYVQRYEDLLALLVRPFADMDHVGEGLVEFIRRQYMRTGIEQAIDLLEKEQIQEASVALQESSSLPITLKRLTGTSLVETLEQRVQFRRTAVKNGIPTGTPLDPYLSPGGLPPKRVGAIMAPPGGGKSATLTSFAGQSVLNGFWPALFLTAENPKEECMDRFDAFFSGVRLKNLALKEKTVMQAIRKLDPRAIIVEEYPNLELTTAEIESLLKRLAHKSIYPKIIFIDYLDEMAADTVLNDRYAELGMTSSLLCRLAKNHNLPIWTATQANRASAERPVLRLSDVVESWKKVMVLDVVVGLSQTLDQRASKSACNLSLLKNRLGVKDVTVVASCDWGRQRIGY